MPRLLLLVARTRHDGEDAHLKPLPKEVGKTGKCPKHAPDRLFLFRTAIHELSGGERQRVIIARALAQQPSILLLDEPTSFLDLNHQVEVFDLLRHVCASDGLAVLCVSHDLNLSSEYCHRLLMLKDGRTYAEGPPEDILTHGHIKAVFETDVTVIKSPYSGSPQIILKPGD